MRLCHEGAGWMVGLCGQQQLALCTSLVRFTPNNMINLASVAMCRFTVRVGLPSLVAGSLCYLTAGVGVRSIRIEVLWDKYDKRKQPPLG